MNNNMVGISIYQCISANISHTNAYQVYFNRGNSYVLIHIHQCLRTHCALSASGLQFNQRLPYPLRFRQSRYSARSSSVGSVMPWLRLKWLASRYSLSSIGIGSLILDRGIGHGQSGSAILRQVTSLLRVLALVLSLPGTMGPAAQFGCQLYHNISIIDGSEPMQNDRRTFSVISF